MKLFIKAISFTILLALTCATIVQSLVNVQIVEIIEDETDSSEDETSLEIEDLFANTNSGYESSKWLPDENQNSNFLISMNSQQFYHKIPCPPPEL